MNTATKLASKVREILVQYLPLLESISNDEFSSKPNENKWSKKEILGHLNDSAYNNHQRFLRAEKNGKLIFQGYDQEQWVRKNNYQNRHKKEVIDLFISVNSHLATLIENLDQEVLVNETTEHNFDQICMFRIEKNTITTLKYLIEDYTKHLVHHLDQITS